MARSFKLLLAVIFVAGCLSVAQAQNGMEAARNTGYNDGTAKGTNDARQGKSFDLNRHDAYKDADNGYHGSFGSKSAYQQAYRQAFERGYRAGYQQQSGVRQPGGYYPGAGVPPRPTPRMEPQEQSGPPGHWTVPGRRVGQQRREEREEQQQYGRGGRAAIEAARNTGYNDGLQKGRSDSSQGKSFDPQRHDAYNDADNGYHDNFGDKNAYRGAYRQAFMNGYRAGYQQRGRRR